MKNALNGENPNHTPHIQEFCDYADTVSLGRAEEVKEQLLSMVQQVLDSNKVKVEVDKKICSTGKENHRRPFQTSSKSIPLSRFQIKFSGNVDQTGGIF